MSTNNLTIAEITRKTIPFLTGKGLPNPRLEADLMLAAVLGLPRVKLYSEWDRPLTPAEVQEYREILTKRVQGWPLAYLTGKKSFLNWELSVTPAVLIPRPETEELVETAITAVKGREGLRGADIGTGSGAIVISLAKALPGSRWYGVDISSAALEVARANAVNLGVDGQITFIRGNLAEPLLDSGCRFDLIVANPPYIPSSDIESLQPEVRREPRLALDGGPDGLEIYRRLIPDLPAVLAADGLVVVEHGHDQRQPLEALFRSAGYSCASIPDLAGRDRILKVWKETGVGHGQTIDN
jgi:release factor glutamine methyltransferase